MNQRRKLIITVPLLLLAVAVTALIAAGVGAVHIPIRDAVLSIFRPDSVSPETLTIIRELRLPRIIVGLLVGGGLALAGIVFQALLRNPLADPYILGVSSGAAVGVVTASLLGLGGVFWASKLFAFAGAMTTVIIVFRIARIKERLYPHTMLLTGVIVNAFFSAAIMFFISIARSDQIYSIFFWLMGNLALSSMGEALVLGIVFVCVSVIVFYHARNMNLLLGGDESAASLGVEVERTKLVLFVAASALTAVVVSAAGVVGFVGLIVPHMLRMVLGADHRALIPTAVLFGGLFLVVADTAARTVIAPLELPVGVLTALFGAPFFIYLLRREL
ncbi:MAG: iron ABC transporter permease [Deltaproteobacteria bacterium]|nr:iron ABC transporter permease [Candidatus Zymogenaceae bacterium]